MAKPTILFVPGSFSPSTIHANLIGLLKEQGFPAMAVQLPSTQKRMPLEPATMLEDADVVRRAAETLIGLGREVVVLCHSYGGTPTTQGLAGVPVKRIIYLTSVAPQVGQTHIEALNLPATMFPPAEGGYMHMDALLMAGAILNDIPLEEAYPLALQMPHHSRVSFDGKVTQAAYAGEDGVPVSYILCEKDVIISPELQRGFIKTIEEGSGKKVDVWCLEAGHCPNWSMPEKLVEVIVKAVGKV